MPFPYNQRGVVSPLFVNDLNTDQGAPVVFEVEYLGELWSFDDAKMALKAAAVVKRSLQTKLRKLEETMQDVRDDY
jgi:hypothetical protein